MTYQLKARWYVVMYQGVPIIAQDVRNNDSIVIGPVSFEVAYQFIYGE